MQELDADEGGFQRLKDAKISTDGVESFFNRMEAMSSMPAILSDHPASAERARLAESLKPKNPIPILTTSEWLVLRKACR
jgi:predicted Zn-dependent protease